MNPIACWRWTDQLIGRGARSQREKAIYGWALTHMGMGTSASSSQLLAPSDKEPEGESYIWVGTHTHGHGHISVK